MPKAKESKAEKMTRQEVERLEGVVARRGAKHEDAKRKLAAAKTRHKDAKKKKTATKKKTTKAKSKKKAEK